MIRRAFRLDRTPTAHALVIGAIVAVGLALRIPGLTESVWYDELWSTRVMLGSLESLVRTIAWDVHPPFNLAVMFVWIRVFGDSELSVRTIPLVSGLLTIVLTARLARRYGGAIAAYVAALMLALSPVHIWYSQEARHYSLLLLLLVASLLAFHRVRETNATRWYAGYALLALCLVVTHYFAIAYIGAVALLSLRESRMRARMVAIAGATAAALALFLAVKARLWGLPTRAGSLRSFEIADLWRLPFEWFLTGNALGGAATRPLAASAALLVAQLGFLVLAAIGLARAGAAGGGGGAGQTGEGDPTGRASPVPRYELALLLLILPAGLLAIAAVGGEQFYNHRSALTALPLFATAVGVGVAALRPPALRGAATGGIAAFGAVVLVGFYARQDEWTVYKPNPDYRTIGRALAEERARTGTRTAVVSLSPALELTYYGGVELLYYPPGPSASAGDGIPPRAAARGAAPGAEPAADGLRARLNRFLRSTADSARDPTGRVYVVTRPERAVVREILEREGDAPVYFARNAYWLGTDPPNHVILASDRLLGALQSDSGFVVEPAAEAKGLRLYRVRLAPGAADR